MSELKLPAFLVDLYYDLRDRRLLPLVALVLVAIVAVPILMGSDSEERIPAPSQGAATLKSLGSAEASKLTVVEATPGLRDYRKRLNDRTPTDPFKQRYTGLPESAQVETTQSTTSGGSGGSNGSGEVQVVEGEGGGSGETRAPSGDGGSGGGDGGSAQRYELVIDVQITRREKTADGGEVSGELEVRHDVPVLTQLPGKKTPVVTTMGANFQKERLVFLVSHEVKSITGEFACITRGEVCELLEVRPGALLEYVYEPSGARYAIKVTNVRIVPARKGRKESRSSRAAFFRGIQERSWKRHSFSK